MAWDVMTAKRIGLVAANHAGYVEAMFQCLEAGDIAVPLRSTEDSYRITAANLDRVLEPSAGGAWMRRSFSASSLDEVALIAFTSGTEGNPKGVMLTHRNLGDVVERLNSVMQLDASISEYIGVPVYHSFGFGRCRAIATVGGRFFIPGNGFNPSEIGTMLKNGDINAISAVPSLWRLLLANQDLIGPYGRRVRWIEIGSQYMSRQEKESLKNLFPEAHIVQHYGLTEASRTTLLEIHQAEGEHLESVGQALGSVAIRLTEDGRIAIRGHHVARQYLIDGQTVNLQDEEGWFLTKDLGHLDNGYLYYDGRADDVINCGGLKVHPETLETKIYSRLGYSQELAICRKQDPLRGEGFLVAVTPNANLDKQHLREVVLQATRELGVNAANAITIIDVDSLPRTPTGKIQRRKLEDTYTQKLQQEVPTDTNPIEPSEACGDSIESIFCRVLNLKTVRPEDTFVSLGGDSLSYVQLSIQLERHLGHLSPGWEALLGLWLNPYNRTHFVLTREAETLTRPCIRLAYHQIPRRAGWEKVTIANLAQSDIKHPTYTTLDTNILFRALSIMSVVVNHADLFPMLGGGSMLLLLIAGLNLSRFQGTALLQGQGLRSAISLLQNILIPYWLIAAAYELWQRIFEPSILFLTANFISPDINSIFPIWFVDVLVQSILIFVLIFSHRAIRDRANQSPWRFGLILLAIAVGLRVFIPYVWNTDYLYNRLPHMLIWLLVLGWCIYFAQSKTEKIVTTGLIVGLAPALMGWGESTCWWVMVGGCMLVWISYVPIPTVLKSPLQQIGAAAYHIYLTHMIFIHFVKNVAGIENPLINATVALLGGVFLSISLQRIQQFLWLSGRPFKRVFNRG